MALQLIGTLGGTGGGGGLPGVGMPAGGTTGQVLAKTSDVNYATGWSTPFKGLNGATGIWTGTQAEYTAIASPVSTVVYIVKA